MSIFTIIALLGAAVIIAYYHKSEVAETLPLVTAGFILLLYVLAFFRGLWLIDFISLGALAGAGYYYCKSRIKENSRYNVAGKHFFGKFASELNIPQLLAIVLMLVLLTLSQLSRIATWWDDINFWATDVKALYYLNGFAGKYGNVAPEFGDYPPAVQLFKWFFLHLNTREYVEGLGFSGYLCLNFILSLPLLKRLKTRNFVIWFFACIMLVLMPTVANVVCFQGTCTDVTMGIVYGVLLFYIWDMAQKEKNTGMSRAVIALYGSVLVLIKSVGIEWLVFAFLFYLLMRRYDKKIQPRKLTQIYPELTAWLAPVIVWLSWIIFCLFNRRVSKLTSSGVRMAVSGNADIKGYAVEKARFYLEGFSLYPMHTDLTPVFDISALIILIMILLLTVVLFIKKCIDKAAFIRLLIFTLLTAFAAYGIIFLGHITIFAMETQYSSGEVMAISISRYGAPFVIGMMFLLCGILTGACAPRADRTRHTGVNAVYACIALFILLTCDYKGVYKGLWGYRDTLSEDIKARGEMLDDNAMIFVDKISELNGDRGHNPLYGKRVLYLHNGSGIYWVKDAYLNLEASPAALVYQVIDEDTAPKDMEQLIRDSHAEYIYAEKGGKNAEMALKAVLGDEFEYEKICQTLD